MPQTSSRRVHSLSAAAAPFRMCSRVDGDRRIISLSGELDVATAQTLERALEAAEAGDARVTVLDLRALDFIDCSGLRVILNAHRRASHRLLVVKGPERVQRVFELCGLHQVLAFGCETGDRGERRAGSLNGVTRAGLDRATGSLRAATARRAAPSRVPWPPPCETSVHAAGCVPSPAGVVIRCPPMPVDAGVRHRHGRSPSATADDYGSPRATMTRRPCLTTRRRTARSGSDR